MTATVVIAESNGAGETVTDDVSDSNMGSVDSAELDPVANPVVPGENTFEKYQRIHVSAMGGSASISTPKVWRTGALGSGNAAHKTNARETSYAQKSYATPTATTSTQATQDMPTSEPTGANLGIGGSLAGTLTDVGYSDYLVHQIQTDAADTAGATMTMNYQYAETA